MSTVISGWSAVSAFGVGATALADGLRAGRDAASALDADRWPVPADRAFVVPDFDAREILGIKGTKSMDRVSALAVITAGGLLGGTGGPDGDRIDGIGDDAGLVLGVNNGSAQSILELTRDSIVKARPEFVKPGQFPNTLMNSASAQCAIWHRLRGPNLTVAAGRAAGLVAVNHARRLQRAGRAPAVLCGAAEEYSATRAWLEHHAAPERSATAVLGEGCAMLLLEPAGVPARHGRTELAELLGVAFGVYREPEHAATALTRCVRRVLAAAGEPPDRVWAQAHAGDAGLASSSPDGGIDDALDGHTPLRLPVADLVGDTHAASAAFGIAAVLALAAGEPEAGGRSALVTAVDRDGMVGCALLRLADTTS